MTIEDLADAFGELQQHDVSVASVRIHPEDAHHLMCHAAMTSPSSGRIWGATIRKSRSVRRGTFELRADKEFRKEMPVQIFRLCPHEEYDPDEAY